MKSLGGIDRESLTPDSAGIYHDRKRLYHVPKSEDKKSVPSGYLTEW